MGHLESHPLVLISQIKVWELPPNALLSSTSLFTCIHLGRAPSCPVCWLRGPARLRHPAPFAYQPINHSSLDRMSAFPSSIAPGPKLKCTSTKVLVYGKNNSYMQVVYAVLKTGDETVCQIKFDSMNQNPFFSFSNVLRAYLNPKKQIRVSDTSHSVAWYNMWNKLGLV